MLLSVASLRLALRCPPMRWAATVFLRGGAPAVNNVLRHDAAPLETPYAGPRRQHVPSMCPGWLSLAAEEALATALLCLPSHRNTVAAHATPGKNSPYASRARANPRRRCDDPPTLLPHPPPAPSEHPVPLRLVPVGVPLQSTCGHAHSEDEASHERLLASRRNNPEAIPPNR